MAELTETCPADSRLPFAQGDILTFANEVLREDRDATHGVIINADCDLENEKLDGFISYLPAYPIGTYLNRFWAAKHLTGILTEALERISGICELKPEETRDLRDWLSTAGQECVSSTLFERVKLKRSAQDTASKALARAAACLSNLEPIQKLVQLAALESNPQGYLVKQLVAGRQAIGDSGFFISEIHGEQELGFVIRLNRVLSLPAASCFKSHSDRISASGDHQAAVRIARLTPTYKFRVAQLFAHQFSRIGLPNDLIALDKIALDELASNLKERAEP